LLEVAVGDHIEQDEATIGILGAHARIVHGAPAFRGIVYHRHEFAAVSFKSRESGRDHRVNNTSRASRRKV